MQSQLVPFSRTFPSILHIWPALDKKTPEFLKGQWFIWQVSIMTVLHDSLGFHLWWDCFQVTFFSVSRRTSTRAPSSFWQFWITHLEKDFSTCIFANLPPTFKVPSIHNVRSFVPTLQHQSLAHGIKWVGSHLGFYILLTWQISQYQLPNGFWENLMKSEVATAALWEITLSTKVTLVLCVLVCAS